MKHKRIIVIGAGAAGYFAAINTKLLNKDHEVVILEKSNKSLSKVRISGGGRCNVTHHCHDITELLKYYPRGQKELRQVFSRFNVQSTIDWFRSHGVSLKTESDGRMFPISDSSETIISCFNQLANKLGIHINYQTEVLHIKKNTEFVLKTTKGEYACDAIICSAGGNPKEKFYDFIKELGHTIIQPKPSLFTFNLPGNKITKLLQGISVKDASVKINSKLNNSGPLLITHWGMSGPAILKLSSFGSTYFFEKEYVSDIHINWTGHMTQEEVLSYLSNLKMGNSKQLIYNSGLVGLPNRLKDYLIDRSGITQTKKWADISKKEMNALVQNLCNDHYKMEGKTTFKEEFVTAGGVELKEVDFKTMESKLIKGLYFCGEVLNIDGVTGGFNFQAAWSTAFLCADSLK